MPNDEVLTTQDTGVDLRESYAEALGALESTEAATDNAQPNTETAGDKAASVDTSAETAEQKADRLRDEQGRFKAGDAKTTAAQTAPVTAAAPKIARPTSWKKDHWESFDKLAAENPALAQYINQRESEFATGVSTYKQEYDRVKPLDEAMRPIMPLLQQHGRDPAEWITTMAGVHQTFAFGSPQQKIQATLKLLQDYNVPLGDYITQGGQLPQFNPNAPQQQAPQPQQPDVRALVQQELQMHQTVQSVKSFTEAKDASGNPKYPHFETVKQDMIGLLQAGLARDLEGAYDKAIRMHDDIWQEQLAAKAAADQAEKAAAAKAKVTRAKANNVSITDSTRSADMHTGGDKDIRSMYAEGLDAAMTGRV